jgi:hypothetical protein
MDKNIVTKNEETQQCNDIFNELTGIDHLIIKIIIGVFVMFVTLLVILVVYKLAIQNKLIYKLSQYF